MGRNFTKIGFKTISVTLGLLTLGVFVPTLIDAQAFTAVAQTTPAISSATPRPKPLARDASTFESDKTLNAACRKTRQNISGDSQSAITRETCLCVTHILKYELTLPEYRAVVRIYGVSGDRTQLYSNLQDEGISRADINTAERIERGLIGASDFTERCAEARAYYR